MIGRDPGAGRFDGDNGVCPKCAYVTKMDAEVCPMCGTQLQSKEVDDVDAVVTK